MTPTMISSAIADTRTITETIKVNLGFQDFGGGERSSERERGEKEAGCVGGGGWIADTIKVRPARRHLPPSSLIRGLEGCMLQGKRLCKLLHASFKDRHICCHFPQSHRVIKYDVLLRASSK